ncbi:uncharacterized protein LOC142787121 [Rhipicephalus microplus]|uniref:uncharacterized protein LOC142787121 n=1 Tax=Rhipicephalus microplus TaxID=6941 RepID=UPI003F6D7516
MIISRVSERAPPRAKQRCCWLSSSLCPLSSAPVQEDGKQLWRGAIFPTGTKEDTSPMSAEQMLAQKLLTFRHVAELRDTLTDHVSSLATTDIFSYWGSRHSSPERGHLVTNTAEQVVSLASGLP